MAHVKGLNKHLTPSMINKKQAPGKTELYLNRPEWFIFSPFPSGEQETDNLLNIIAGPKDKVHLLGTTYHILYRFRNISEIAKQKVTFKNVASQYLLYALTGNEARVTAPHLSGEVLKNSLRSSSFPSRL